MIERVMFTDDDATPYPRYKCRELGVIVGFCNTSSGEPRAVVRKENGDYVLAQLGILNYVGDE